MPTRGDIEHEAWVLTKPEGQALLAEVGQVRSSRPADLARWRKSASLEQVNAALSLSLARMRGAAKFSRADRMWLEKTGLEQATAEIVANHKARRFEGETVVDLCSGIGGDAIALAAKSKVIAVDLDSGMGRRLRWNAGVYEVGERVETIESRAEEFAIPAGAMVHIDPDRRSKSNSRAIGLDGYSPGLDFLQGLARSARGGAVKLGPASDFDRGFAGHGFEIELISLNGECKEAAVWFGALAGCRRRATCLPRGATWTDRDAPSHAYAEAGPIREWVFDPDPALLRAGLLDGFAAVHGLGRIVAGVDYLTGPVHVDSPFLAGFEVIGVYPLDMKTIKREISRRRIGTLEIKTRGFDRTPEVIRSDLRPEGENAATLLLAGGLALGHGRAILARRWPFM